jgi:hypothetical protein
MTSALHPDCGHEGLGKCVLLLESRRKKKSNAPDRGFKCVSIGLNVRKEGGDTTADNPANPDLSPRVPRFLTQSLIYKIFLYDSSTSLSSVLSRAIPQHSDPLKGFLPYTQ